MAYISNPGATLTFAAGSKTVNVAGTNPILEDVRAGDLAVHPAGALPIASRTATTITLVLPAPANATVEFNIMWGPSRSLVAQATATTREVWAQITAWADRGLSIPVIAQQNAPPSTPADGDRYLVGTAGSGAWAGNSNRFATWSATSGRWEFTPPVAGWAATINGSLVRLQFTGTAWGATSPIAGTTTVAGRLARFTDTAGGLGQSAMSEDGAGNVSIAASISAGAEVQARDGANMGRFYRSGNYVRLASNSRELLALDDIAGTGHLINYAGAWKEIWHAGLTSFSAPAAAMTLAGLSVSGNVLVGGVVLAPGLTAGTGAPGLNGYARLSHGDGSATGYLEFFHKDDTRRGYIGYAAGGTINMVAEGGYGWNISGNVVINSQLKVGNNVNVNNGTAHGGTVSLGLNANSVMSASDAAQLNINAAGYALVNITGNTSVNGALTTIGDVVCLGTALVGNDTGQAYVRVKGGASGANAGGAVIIDLGGVFKHGFGNRSAIYGGAYDETAVLYAASGLHIQSTGVRMLAFGAGTLVTDASGNVTASSTRRLKTDVEPWEKGLDAVLALNPVSFNWSPESGLDRLNRYHGFIAEEVDQALSEAVGMDQNGDLTLMERPIIGALVNAIKELHARIEALETA